MKKALDELEKICRTCMYARPDKNNAGKRLCYQWKTSWGPAQKRDTDSCGMWNFGAGSGSRKSVVRVPGRWRG